MEEGNSRWDLGYYSLEIVKDKQGNPQIIVKFKSEGKGYWVKEFKWYPTSEELEFLYRTMKWMEKGSSKGQPLDTQGFHAPGETT
jgi:hypothetical protein